LILSVVGFGVTIYGVWRAKGAAQAAEQASANARDVLIRSTIIADLAGAMSTMEEIKRLHRVDAWHLLPDRYSVLRRTLISIRASNLNLDESAQKTLQSAIQHFASIEQSVERALAVQSSPKDVPRL
jgi:hypothetical protein